MPHAHLGLSLQEPDAAACRLLLHMPCLLCACMLRAACKWHQAASVHMPSWCPLQMTNVVRWREGEAEGEKQIMSETSLKVSVRSRHMPWQGWSGLVRVVAGGIKVCHILELKN